MRETRQSGSEGGGAVIPLSLPYPADTPVLAQLTIPRSGLRVCQRTPGRREVRLRRLGGFRRDAGSGGRDAHPTREEALRALPIRRFLSNMQSIAAVSGPAKEPHC
jgi:hypothetical protein